MIFDLLLTIIVSIKDNKVLNKEAQEIEELRMTINDRKESLTTLAFEIIKLVVVNTLDMNEVIFLLILLIE